MTLGSLFDGIGGWQLAAVRAGIKPLWSSEIDEFCCQVTRRHFPDTVQLGDINNIADAPHVDIITAGSPCQDLSIAGKRSGIYGSRSGLFFKAVELVRRIKPKFFIWENVPHVLNVNGGKDFAQILSEITQTEIPVPQCGFANAGVVDFDGGQLAYRILDAQYWGTAQRRRRIFLVADFAGRHAAQILFEQSGLRRNSATGAGKECNSSTKIRDHINPPIGFDTGSTFPWANKDLTPTIKTTSRLGAAIFDMTHADEVLRLMPDGKVNCLNARAWVPAAIKSLSLPSASGVTLSIKARTPSSNRQSSATCNRP